MRSTNLIIVARPFVLITSVFLWASVAWASPPVDVERLADAIYKAENSKAHPYGIMAHYKHTTPRQAAINTIKHALKDWNGQGTFIAFLGSRYCPTTGKLRPAERRLNGNWINNVTRLYNKGV
jgi:hypothetical protein